MKLFKNRKSAGRTPPPETAPAPRFSLWCTRTVVFIVILGAGFLLKRMRKPHPIRVNDLLKVIVG